MKIQKETSLKKRMLNFWGEFKEIRHTCILSKHKDIYTKFVKITRFEVTSFIDKSIQEIILLAEN